MDYSEKLIINGLKVGDQEAYRYVYDSHYQVLCYTANKYVHDQFVAETIVGDIIFKLWERESIDINTSLRSYLARSVRNASLDYLRSKRQRYEVAQSRLADNDTIDDTMSIASGDDPLANVIGDELEALVQDAISALPYESRRVFEMSRFMGKKQAEIADELGISVSTVKYHIGNALKLLARDLGKYVVALLFMA